MNEQSFSMAPYLDIFYRHRLAFISTLVVGVILTLLAVVLLPNVYVSSTLVTIEPQEVPAQYVSGATAGHIQDRLKILGEKALSRTRLEAIINQFKLYPRRRTNPSGMAQLVSYMRNRVNLVVTKEDDHASGGSFELSFEYDDPALAQAITAQLANGFIEEDRRDRMQQAAATTAFLDDRLANARVKLEEKGKEIREFKDRYQGSLPQDLQVNLQTLSSLQGRLQSASEAEVAMDERRAQLDREFADTRSATVTSSAGRTTAVSPEARLASMEAELIELRSRYSDKYPDVVDLQAQIAALKDRLKQGSNDGKDDDLTQFDAGFRTARDQIAVEQGRLNAEIANVKRSIGLYQQRIAQTPAHQQEYDRLNRDYSVLNTEYHSLLNKRLSAQSSESLEERGEGERFRVVDQANLPRSPERPDKTAVAVGGLVISLLAAFGLAFGLYFTDTSFKNVDDVLTGCGLRVAVAIPQVVELGGEGRFNAAMLRAATLASIAVLIGASAIWLSASMR
jgi:succinoglycan biosynthesis transport protein ExoP